MSTNTSSSSIKVRTVLDGIVKVPTSNNNNSIRTIKDLKNSIYNLRGWESSIQHIYQNGLELNNDQTLSESLISKGFVLLIPINHQQRRYKTGSEIKSESHNYGQQPLASSPLGANNITSPVGSGSVSDQLAQIMEEFATTHPAGSTGSGTATRTSTTNTTPVQQNTNQPTNTQANIPPTTTSQPTRTSQTSTASYSDYQRNLLIDNIPVDEALVAVVMELGFSKRIAKKALILHNMDPESAVEWIFSNTDNPYVLESEFSAEELVQLAQKYQNAMRDE